MLPDATTRREMLEQRREGFKRVGFDRWLEAESMEAQYPGASADRKINVNMGEGRAMQAKLGDYLRDRREESKKAYAAAARMQEILDTIPTEESKPTDEAEA